VSCGEGDGLGHIALNRGGLGMNDLIDGLNTAAAAGAGPAFFPHLAGRIRTRAHRSSDGAVGNAFAVTNKHELGRSFKFCGYLRDNPLRIVQ
jgi:hypothetical protein